MKCILIGLSCILVSGYILETSAKPQNRRRNHQNAQRRIYLARQAVPADEIFEEELPSALTETDTLHPNDRIINGETQRLIGATGLSSLLTKKQNLLNSLSSTTTTVAPTTTITGTLTGTVTITPTGGDAIVANEAIAPSNPAVIQRNQQIGMRPVAAGAYGPVIIRRRRGPGQRNRIQQLNALNRLNNNRRRPISNFQVIRNGNGGQIIRVPIPVRLATG